MSCSRDGSGLSARGLRPRDILNVQYLPRRGLSRCRMLCTGRRSRARAIMGKEPQMLKIALLLILALPGLAGAEVWRWKDAAGQLQYSSVAGRGPAHAATARRAVGDLSPVPLALEVSPTPDLGR